MPLPLVNPRRLARLANTWTEQQTFSAPVLLPDGALGTPGLAFASDPDTGIFLNAAGDMQLVVGGVTIIRVRHGGAGGMTIASTSLIPVGSLDVGSAAGPWRDGHFSRDIFVPNVKTSSGVLTLAPAGVTTVLAAATTAGASTRLPHGAAPTAPVDGDMWTTATGLFVRINGATVGPLS